MRRRILALLLVVVWMLGGCQSGPVTPDKLAEITLPPTTQVAFHLADTSSGKSLAGQKAADPAPLASVTKIFTAAAALEILGPSHTFETSVRGKGSLVKDTWNGSIALVGGGDPLLSVGHLMQLATSLRQRGIRKVTGPVYFDAALYSPSAQIDSGMDSGASYNSGVSALSVDFNQVPVPKERIAVEKRKRLPVKDSAAHTASLWASFCRLNGIELKDPVPGGLKGGERLAVHRSVPLSEIVDKMLEYSNNQVAELVLLATAGRKIARPSLDTAAAFLRSWVTSNVKAMKPKLLRGSGLNDQTTSTPAEMTDFLLWAAKRRDPLLHRLSAAGWNGNLLDRLGNADLKFRVWGKTGSLDYVSNLTGYLFSKTGRKLVFSLAVWDDTKRAATRPQTEEERRDEATAWAENVAKFQETLLLSWYRAN